MARVTYVKSARQRYEMVPVLDENGNVKRTPVMRRDGVTPQTTKRGVAVTMKQSVPDRSKPLPNLKCDFPGCDIDGGEILPGTSYKHITPRSGPYGGTQRNRHAAHPNWNVWEYSYSRSAQVARTQSEMHDAIDSYEFSSPEDFDDLKQQLADMAGEQRDEQEEALNNMPEQLQDGSQAQEYYEALETWVDEIDGVDAPDYDNTCLECEGTGTADEVDKWFAKGPDSQSLDEEGFETMDEAQRALDEYLAANPDEDEEEWDIENLPEEQECEQCGGEGTVEDEVSEEWVEEAKDALREAVDNCGM